MNAADPPPMFPSLDSIESVLWPGLALAVFVVTAVLVDVMVLLATRWHILDLPNRRSAHALPTARAGGLPLAMVTALASLAVCIRWPGMTTKVLAGCVVPSMVIAVVGFMDDIRPLGALFRLAIQIAVAAMVVAFLGPLRVLELPGLASLELGPAAWPLSLLWVVGMMNAFNFMDGSDGMAATGAVVVSAFLVCLGFAGNSPILVLLASFVGAASAGFLVFNWPPARIFMGDVGSAFLGTFLAALALLPGEPTKGRIFVPLAMAAWPYIYDPLLSVLRRLVGGHNPLVPHREFLFHRLVRSGWSHLSVALLYATLSLLGALAGRLLLVVGLPPVSCVLLPATIVLMAIGLTGLAESQFRRWSSRS